MKSLIFNTESPYKRSNIAAIEGIIIHYFNGDINFSKRIFYIICSFFVLDTLSNNAIHLPKLPMVILFITSEEILNMFEQILLKCVIYFHVVSFFFHLLNKISCAINDYFPRNCMPGIRVHNYI